ncbi:DNA mismatch repair protein [Paraflavitalea soli]|uniref:DNA mismatch repair protein n=1 Tax=Paraflavitalea soli TaxID=2315862 RepID=A0A3B7MIQ0_9BACT|nr:DNA mismatch repair protein [Paraflavitalea soli]AXY73109.1 DNA mismatch repair protein [Paraflavitalea soli]
MAFIADKQTLDDLNIFGKHRSGGIYHLFNKTHTNGGARLLEEMFTYPLSDAEKINRRSRIIQYFLQKQASFPFANEAFDAIEHYLSNTDERSRLVEGDDTLQRRVRNYMGADTEYELLHKGVVAAIDIFNTLRDFLHQLQAQKAPPAYQAEVQGMETLLQNEQLTWMYEEKGNKKLPYAKTAKYDQVLRFAAREKIRKLLSYLYHMDVYLSIAQVAKDRGFAFTQAEAAGGHTLHIEGMYHPLLPKAVANTLEVDQHSHVIFLTGANMAGKSTFMKTLGITIFLAHMGFPVPAARMTFSVQSGLYTTINLSDNLHMGYSHFYAEVLRLKKVAEQVNRTENIVVIFDELFRGTNVKDAYDATVAITAAFAEKHHCTFVISTHIIEAGEVLKKQFDNINFVYFPTVMNGHIPGYTYQLTSGITNDRHGMMIINNERIIEIIKSRQQRLKTV